MSHVNRVRGHWLAATLVRHGGCYPRQDMATADVYRITDQLDGPALEILATRLEARGKHPRFMAMMRDYLEAVNIDAAGSVLDVGCGTGVAARAIARRPGFTGRVTGIDKSSHLIAAAQGFAEAEGVARAVELRTGDALALELPESSFDRVVAHTLFSHVEDPLGLLREIARHVKPGGAAAIFDGDYASLTFAGEDAASSKADDDTLLSAIVTSPRVMREMPRLLNAAGLTLEASFSYVVADIGKADFWVTAIPAFRGLLVKSGAMAESRARAWSDALLARSDRGVFFGACNYYGYVARRT